jgi:hypothetical protein
MIDWNMVDQVVGELRALSDDELVEERSRLRREVRIVDAAEHEYVGLKLYNSYYVALERASAYIRRLYGIAPSEDPLLGDGQYDIAVPDTEAALLIERIHVLLNETATEEICQSDYPGEWDLYEALLERGGKRALKPNHFSSPPMMLAA